MAPQAAESHASAAHTHRDDARLSVVSAGLQPAGERVAGPCIDVWGALIRPTAEHRNETGHKNGPGNGPNDGIELEVLSGNGLWKRKRNGNGSGNGNGNEIGQTETHSNCTEAAYRLSPQRVM